MATAILSVCTVRASPPLEVSTFRQIMLACVVVIGSFLSQQQIHHDKAVRFV